jgi:tripartite-type tricarboxylate transporter receptor subunit TctC
VQVLDIRNGIGDMLNRVILGAFHVPYHLNTGFESTSALKQGFLAKDGQIMFEAMSTLHSLIKGGQAKPLLVTAESSLPSYQKASKGVPTLQSELSGASLSSSNSAAVQEAVELSNLADDFAAPPGTPAATLATLRTAFTKAASSPALQSEAKKQNLPIGPTSGAALSGQVATALQQANAIAPFVNGKG